MTELLLVAGAVIVVAAAVIIVMPIAATALRLAAAYFFAPVPPPPGLARLIGLSEQVIAARQATRAAERGREPPPAELVLRLREITGSRGERPTRHS